MCVLRSSTALVRNISYSKKKWVRYEKLYIHLHVKYPLLFLSNFHENLIFSTDLKKKNQISNFTKIRPMGAELFRADRRTARRRDTTTLTVDFCNFANMPKKCCCRFYEQNPNYIIQAKACRPTSNIHTIHNIFLCTASYKYSYSEIHKTHICDGRLMSQQCDTHCSTPHVVILLLLFIYHSRDPSEWT